MLAMREENSQLRAENDALRKRLQSSEQSLSDLREEYKVLDRQHNEWLSTVAQPEESTLLRQQLKQAVRSSHTCTHTHTYAHTHASTCTHACTHMHPHAHTQTHTHKQICAYTHACTTRAPFLLPLPQEARVAEAQDELKVTTAY